MTRKLPTDDPDGVDDAEDAEYLQFRGPQTSVTLDAPNLPRIHFGVERRGDDGRIVHEAKPVVDVDADDPPEGAILRPVAKRIVEQCNLVCWGVACEHVNDYGRVCGDVFETPQGAGTHRGSVHKPDDSGDETTDKEDTENDD